LTPVGFTIKTGGLLWVLESLVNIHPPNNTAQIASINAIWDTGATNSSITSNVVAALGLIPTGIAEVYTANGIAFQKTYTVDIGLPNGVIVEGLVVTEVNALSGDCEALIGMDVITLGDLSVTNYNGNTCMSFRIPSLHEIDFSLNPQFGVE